MASLHQRFCRVVRPLLLYLPPIASFSVIQATAIFESSLEVMVSVYGEHPEGAAPQSGGRVFHCADAYLTVVAVDGQGNPVRVPFQLKPEAEAEVRRGEGLRRGVCASQLLIKVTDTAFKPSPTEAHLL